MKIICQECPNGCNLTLDRKGDKVYVSGNKCNKGILHASHVIKEEGGGHIVVRELTPLRSRETLERIASFWDITLKTIHYDILIEGSPERTVFRVVIEDQGGQLFLVEEIPLRALSIKKKIVQTLEFLSNKNISHIRPYLKNKQGQYILETEKEGFWQIISFEKGEILDRRSYIYEKWRGPLLAQFLISLRRASADISFLDKKKDAFSLKNYIYRLVRQTESRRPDLKDDLVEVINFLEEKFMKAYDKLPKAFCHGDYHPMNIVWGKDDMKYVIDWEFLGYKPEIYDACNLIGCIGVEHPSSLMGDLIMSFIENLKSSKIFSDKSLKYLVEFVVALRFAWLSEWLRREDEEMIELELTYMELLIQNKKELHEAWGL